MRVSLDTAVGRFEDETENTQEGDLVSNKIDLETVMNSAGVLSTHGDRRLSLSDDGLGIKSVTSNVGSVDNIKVLDSNQNSAFVSPRHDSDFEREAVADLYTRELIAKMEASQ